MSPSQPASPDGTAEISHALAECHGQPLGDLDRDFWELFSQTATRYPDHEAVVSLWQSDPGRDLDASCDQDPVHHPDSERTSPRAAPLRWTYGSLLQRSESLAQWLQARGCGPGMHLVAVLWNSAEWALFFWAAAKLKMVFVPLDPRLIAADAPFFIEATSPTVIVVQDSDAEQRLQPSALASLAKTPLRISCSPDPSEDWTSLSCIPEAWRLDRKLIPAESHVPCVPDCNGRKAQDRGTLADRTALIVFTSGTTSRPKGCMHTARNLWAQVHNYDYDPDRFERWLVHTPVSHIFAVNNSLRAWQNGDAVVFASKAFDVQATLRALVEEKCTFMSAIPALIKAILAQPEFPGKEALNLRYVTLGSTLITEADIALCRDKLGSCHAIQAFGMSEGAPVVSWTRPDPLLVNGYHSGVGRVLPGANMRICAPGDHRPLLRNQPGELHIGGPAVISAYLDNVEPASFYSDHVGNWLVTGDQALIDEEGVLHILGRYKDIIIRAGENIAPIKIEGALTEIPGVTAQVVGVPDDIAGQVPVAVVKLPDGSSKTDILNKARSLGPMYALDSVYTLDDLDLAEFPLTITGKVRKEVLKANVLEHRKLVSKGTLLPTSVASNIQLPSSEKSDKNTQKDISKATSLDIEAHPVEETSHIRYTSPVDSTDARANDPCVSGQIDFTKDLLDVWEDLVGIRPSLSEPIYTFADSITLLRYCDRVLNTLGQRMYLQDFTDSPTVQDLATLVNSRAAPNAELPGLGGQEIHIHSHILHPRADEMTNGATKTALVSFPRQFTGMPLSLASPVIHRDLWKQPDTSDAVARALQEIGLGRDFAEDVLPIKDFFRYIVVRQRPMSYVHRICLGLRETTEPDRIRSAMETALSSRPILRTVLANQQDGTPFHVVCKPERRFFDRVIHHQEVDTIQEAEALMSDSRTSHSPRLMVHIQIVTVRPTGMPYLILTYNHIVFDMLSIMPFHSDLDRLVRSPDPSGTAIPALTPFKLFADLYHSYRDSIPAQESVNFNIHRLRGISKFADALWPQQRAPGWMIGSDDGSPHRSERAAIRNEVWANAGLAWDEETAATWRFPRLSRVINLPDMVHIRKNLRVDPQTVVKAALTVFNVRQTGQPFAVFNTVEASRSWPFVPSWIEDMLPHPMTIDGPTVEWVLNMVRVDIHADGKTKEPETVRQLIDRMRTDQASLEEHAHAPWGKVLTGLGREEAAVVVDASSRQTFVWDATVRLMGQGMGDFKAFKIEGRYDWADCGLYWNCCMLDGTNLMIIASWDTAQMNVSEVDMCLDDLADCIRRVAMLGNWDRSVTEVFSR